MNTLILPEQSQKLIDKFMNAGYEAYAVGGCVRDLLMNKEAHDWDFTTNAKPEEIIKLFPDSFYHNQFGTVGVKIMDNKQEEIYEITTFRTESAYSDSRHPDKISWGKTVEQDLARRDFTINAIAYNGSKLVDPYNGQKDITHKLIRAVGDPEKRFKEDALRLLRSVRIAAQLGFMIEEHTSRAIQKMASSLHTISGERIREELFKILQSNNAADGILVLKNLGLLSEILPEVSKAFETEQKSPERHHTYNVGTHLVESLRNCQSTDVITRFATLLHDIGKPASAEISEEGIRTFYNHEVIGTSMARDLAKRLHLSRKDTSKLILLIRWHQFSVGEDQTDKAVRRFIRRVGKENIEAILELRRADRLGGGSTETSWRTELFKKKIVEVQKQPFEIRDLKIDGVDIMKELNIKPGPKVGKILKQLFDEVVDNNLENKKGELLSELKKLFNKEGGENT